MARNTNWSRAASRSAAARSRSMEAEGNMYLAELDGARRGPSKAELAALASAAMAEFTGTVKRLPTMVDLRCTCGHHARVAVAPDRERPRFRCSRCGSQHP